MNSNNNNYTLYKAMRDFDLVLLARGAEIALTSTVKCQISKVEENKYFNSDWSYVVQEYSSDVITLIEGQVINTALIGSYSSEPATILLDNNRGEFIRCACGCGDYRTSCMPCEHIAALMIQYYIADGGIEVLRNTLIEDYLKKITGVETPLVPGILRKTDPGLSDLLSVKKNKKNALPEPSWLQNPKGQDAGGKNKKDISSLISIECVLKKENDRMGVELKAGPKKHFVIKYFDELLNCYRNNKTFKFSNTVSVPAGRSCYSSESQKLMDFFSSLYVNYRRENILDNLFCNNYGARNSRIMNLSGRDLDTFMNMIEGQEISFAYYSGRSEKYKVDFSACPAVTVVEKQEFGANLKIPSQYILGCGIDFMYMIDGENIIRLPADQWEIRKQLAELSLSGREMYISDRDLPAVCSNLLLPLHQEGQLEARGLEVTEYSPEIPVIQIYLDRPQGDMISCQVWALYNTGNKYRIYDRRKDVKKRNFGVEQPVGELLWPMFDSFEEKTYTLFKEFSEDDLFEFVTVTIPRLYEYGEVFISDELKKLKVRRAGNMAVGVNVDAGSLMVSLKSNVMDAEEIAKVLSRYDRKKRFTRLKNGEFITFEDDDRAVWDALSETFKSYGKKNPEAMKVPLFRSLYLDEAMSDRDDVVLSCNDGFRKLVQGLRCETVPKRPIPDTLKEVLRGYQKDGFRWISMLKENGLGGILADDMGLGKTLQVLTFILSEKLKGKSGDELRTLIVAPASLVYNWQREVKQFTPELSCRVIAGSAQQRKEILEGCLEDDIYITSYDLIKRDIAEYDGLVFANEIIDEAQFIKNHNTQVAKAVKVVEGQFRLALTGTPIENRLSELWSIFDYLMPGFLYSYSRFKSDFENLIVNDHDERALEQIKKMVHPFILRRLKKEVLKDLPDKLEETVTVRLEGEQRQLYDAYAERLKLYLDKQNDDEFSNHKIEILAELTKLRQICCGPGMFLEDYSGENAKLETCMELVRQAIDGGHKVLLFSQFTRSLDEIGNELEKDKISYHRIDGSVSKENRMKMVTSFDKDDVPVFCVSLKAGGTGLNLTAADIVIHYDPWWNVAAQNQATDRAHRIGQTNTVTVYQLIAEDTVEEQIVKLQQSKAKLAGDVLEGEGIAGIMIDKDALLSLLE